MEHLMHGGNLLTRQPARWLASMLLVGSALFRPSPASAQPTQPISLPKTCGCSCCPTARTPDDPATQESTLDKINHIVVIYQENHSFDNYLGTFPGANGISNAGAASTQ